MRANKQTNKQTDLRFNQTKKDHLAANTHLHLYLHFDKCICQFKGFFSFDREKRIQIKFCEIKMVSLSKKPQFVTWYRRWPRYLRPIAIIHYPLHNGRCHQNNNTQTRTQNDNNNPFFSHSVSHFQFARAQFSL